MVFFGLISPCPPPPVSPPLSIEALVFPSLILLLVSHSSFLQEFKILVMKDKSSKISYLVTKIRNDHNKLFWSISLMIDWDTITINHRLGPATSVSLLSFSLSPVMKDPSPSLTFSPLSFPLPASIAATSHIWRPKTNLWDRLQCFLLLSLSFLFLALSLPLWDHLGIDSLNGL